jgi:hypothetical protein
MRKTALIYNIPYTIFNHRFHKIIARRDSMPNSRAMIKLEEQTIVKYVLDLDSREFPPAIAQIENIANILRKSRNASRVGTRWMQRFVNRRAKLKTRWNRPYDY